MIGAQKSVSIIYQNDNQNKNIRNLFPYIQNVQGDGACYFNACFVAILNRCVGNVDNWNFLRNYLMDKSFENYANQIGKENEILTYKKVNDILRSQINFVKDISIKLLTPLLKDMSKEKLRTVIQDITKYQNLESKTSNDEKLINYISDNFNFEKLEPLLMLIKENNKNLKFSANEQELLNILEMSSQELKATLAESSVSSIINKINDAIIYKKPMMKI